MVAATVNAFVGPFNATMWIVPIFMAGFAAITFILVPAALQQTDNPNKMNWLLRRILGKQVAHFWRWCNYFLRRCNRWGMRITSLVFLYFVPSMFLVAAAAMLLIYSIRGEINGGN